MNHKYVLCSCESWMMNKPGESFMPPLSVCFPWLEVYRCHTKLYARLWKYLGSYSKLVHLCVCRFWLCVVRCWKFHVWCFLGLKELLNLLQRYWVGTAGPVPWPGRSCEFIVLDNVFWDYVSEHIYIQPFRVLLMERNTVIEHVYRPVFSRIVCSIK